jgi:hypothetical protein
MKSFALKYAAEHGIFLVSPDTSPRKLVYNFIRVLVFNTTSFILFFVGGLNLPNENASWEVGRVLKSIIWLIQKF